MDSNVVSGMHPNNQYPLVDGELDPEQKRRQAAREDSERARNRGTTPSTEGVNVNEPDNTPSQENPTGATSPEEVVDGVREQVADSSPVESAPDQGQQTTVEETHSTTVTESPANDSETPNQ